MENKFITATPKINLEQTKNIVTLAIFSCNRLLVIKPTKTANKDIYTLVGGAIEGIETPMQAIIRETKEKIGINFEEDELFQIMEFDQEAASDPEKTVHNHLFVTTKVIKELPPLNKKITDVKWYKIGDGDDNVSHSITDYLVPYALEHNLMVRGE